MKILSDARLLNILFQTFSFIAVFAAVASGVIIFYVRKKFGTGILARGFKNMSAGVFFMALGILFDVFLEYFRPALAEPFLIAISLIKGLFFLVGTYIIVIAGKKMADDLESLLK